MRKDCSNQNSLPGLWFCASPAMLLQSQKNWIVLVRSFFKHVFIFDLFTPVESQNRIVVLCTLECQREQESE